MRNTRVVAAGLLTVLAAACGEVETTAPSAAFERAGSAASAVPGACSDLAELNRLAAVLFTPGSSPNINSVRGKLKNLDQLVRKGNFAEAEGRAGEIVAFTLKKHNQGGLSGDADDVKAFTNKVLCFAGIDVDVEEPTNSYFILPSDTAQIIRNIEGSAGINFPANPVVEPTLVTFAVIEDTYPAPGAGPLDTKLDQYPGFISITKQSETDAPLAKPVVVAVCAQGAIPADVRARLRLGHNASAGFEVTPAANGDFLSCPIQTADGGAAPLWKRLASSLLPKELHAFQEFAGGGVGGTATEFSPFAPVDPVLEFGGGVGGTATEFMRSSFSSDLFGAGPATLAVDCSTGAVGSEVPTACRPFITIATRLGTPLSGVPVQWTVTAGDGRVAASAGGSCGTFGSTAEGLSGFTGRAEACWQLGTLVGLNQLRATPTAGGDAPTGVSFTPANRTFEVAGIAGPPAAMEVVQGGAQQWGVPEGSIVPIAPTVRLVDRYGNPVPGIPVFWATFPSSRRPSTLSPTTVLTGPDGRATTSWTMGEGYQGIYAFLYVRPDGSVSSEYSADALKLWRQFEATTEF